MSGIRAIVFLAVLVLVSAGYVKDDTFDNIKNSPTSKFVLFYRSSDKSSETLNVLATVESAAKMARSELSQVHFLKCDGDAPDNREEYKNAQFGAGTFLFTATMDDGIQKYPHETKDTVIVRHLKSLFAPATPNLVKSFVDEDNFFEIMDLDPHPKPIFVKFYIDTCVHCKQYKLAFQRIANYFKGKVHFMEVNCNSNEDSIAFCSKSGARSYPTLVLFTGEEKIAFEESDRSYLTVEKFFLKHVPESVSALSSEADTEEEEPPKIVKSKKNKKSKKATAAESDESRLESLEQEHAKLKIAELEKEIARLKSKVGGKKSADHDEL